MTPVLAPLPDLPGRLKAHVRMLAGDIGDRSVASYANLKAAAAYIGNQFAASGYPEELQRYRTGGLEVSNIIASKRGTRAPGEVILVGAHYDSCNNPGADDNASGVAGLLELARLLAGASSERIIRFVAFANEEPPFFRTEAMGSWVYARAARLRGESIRAMICLEMIGYYSDTDHSQHYPPIFGWFYPHRGNFLGVVSDFRSSALNRRLVRAFRRRSDFPIASVAMSRRIDGVSWSDHWAFWQEGYPAVMVTDTAFLRNPHYHLATDTWDILDYPRMARAVHGLYAAILELAGPG